MYFSYDQKTKKEYNGIAKEKNVEYLIINDNKLKIMMTGEDMTSYGIDPENSDYENPQVRRAFWRILDAARVECGFKVSGDKLLIQFYPSSGGGEIFVTKLGKIASGAERTISKSSNVAMLSSRNVIYRFSGLSALLTVARELSSSERDVPSDVYFCEDGCYYLLMEERSAAGVFSQFARIGEFASELPSNLEPYIREHSTLIASATAIEVLSKF